jgi:hypothetical protein
MRRRESKLRDIIICGGTALDAIGAEAFAVDVAVTRDRITQFRPELTPAEMLRFGVFYISDTGAEFPAAWFDGARLAHGPATAARSEPAGARLSSAILDGDTGFDIGRQPAQICGRGEWNGWGLRARATAPEDCHVSLQVSALHDVPQSFQTSTPIAEWRNQPVDRL